MDWARDQLGQLVHASQGGNLSYRVLSCPLCRERVYRRAGQQRRAHFAHFSHRAKPECENYHPSESHSVAGPSPYREGGQSDAPVSAPQVAILLEVNDDKVAMYLRLPAFPGIANSEEAVELRTGLGIRRYSVTALCRSRIVPVTLRLPLVTVVASSPPGVSGATKEVIEAGVSAFRSNGNFFRFGESGRRLLGVNEPLEWGERYSLLTQRRLPSASGVFGIDCEVTYEQAGWVLYEITLPSLDWAATNEAKGAIERYLNRRIVLPRPRAHFISPPPHHVEIDGTHVFPEGTQEVVLWTGGPGDIYIQSISSRARFQIERDNETCRLSISGDETFEFTVQLNGRDVAMGRMESCPIFMPSGVQVLVDGRALDIFRGDLPDIVRAREQPKLKIAFPSERVARLFELAEANWKREGAAPTFTSFSREPGFDAKNFGSLAHPPAVSVNDELAGADGQLVARQVWIAGLIARLSEGAIAYQHGEQAHPTLGPHRLRIYDPELEWLRPYVAFAWSD